MKSAVLPLAVLSAVVLAGADAEAVEPPPISVGEVSPPPEIAGVDAGTIRDAAEGEIRQIDAAQLPERKRYVVSLALTKAIADGPVACTINAMVRDARTGVMVAIIEAGAQAQGPVSAELRKQVAHAAVRSAVRGIPRAIAVK